MRRNQVCMRFPAANSSQTWTPWLLTEVPAPHSRDPSLCWTEGWFMLNPEISHIRVLLGRLPECEARGSLVLYEIWIQFPSLSKFPVFGEHWPFLARQGRGVPRLLLPGCPSLWPWCPWAFAAGRRQLGGSCFPSTSAFGTRRVRVQCRFNAGTLSSVMMLIQTLQELCCLHIYRL